jgi:E3 ubiquitin-protein ligase synoviolin
MTMHAHSMPSALCTLCAQVFLGTLREAEVERINNRISQAIMETCLAMTIFREEFNVSFVAMFTILTFVKVFHWLVQDRVDYIETTPSVSRLQHFRIVTFIMLLLVSQPPGQCSICASPPFMMLLRVSQP